MMPPVAANGLTFQPGGVPAGELTKPEFHEVVIGAAAACAGTFDTGVVAFQFCPPVFI